MEVKKVKPVKQSGRSGYEKVRIEETGMKDIFDDDRQKDPISLDEENTLQRISDGVQEPPNQWRGLNFFLKNLVPDNEISIKNYPLVEGSFTIKLLKFITLTFVSIALVHWIVPKITSDYDKHLLLSDILRFHGSEIIGDSIIFYLVGRLWRQRGVDHLGWILPIILCNAYFEIQHKFDWLQHSISMYTMHCIWPIQTWIYAIIVVSISSLIILLHLNRAYRNRVILTTLMEMFLSILFFVAPSASSKYFHLHHWFGGWLLGMHFNFDVWWSRAAMAYSWGMYINGIAAFGRDPLLTCEYALFTSIGNGCPFIRCYLDSLNDVNNTSHHNVTEMIPADWRDCSASGFIS